MKYLQAFLSFQDTCIIPLTVIIQFEEAAEDKLLHDLPATPNI